METQLIPVNVWEENPKSWYLFEFRDVVFAPYIYKVTKI